MISVRPSARSIESRGIPGSRCLYPLPLGKFRKMRHAKLVCLPLISRGRTPWQDTGATVYSCDKSYDMYAHSSAPYPVVVVL